jgi:hypothetical protein
MFTFTPRRAYDTDLKLEANDHLQVDVKHEPNGIRVETETRSSIVYTIPVLICIRKHFTQSEQNASGLPSESDIDQLVEFTEQMCEFFAMNRLIAEDAVSTEPGEMASLVPQDELRTNRQFFGAVRVVCRATKAV